MTGTTTASKNDIGGGSDRDFSFAGGGYSDDSSDEEDIKRVTQKPPPKVLKPTIHKPSRKRNTIQAKMMEQERRKQARLRRQQARIEAMNSDLDIDSDEELGLNESPKKDTNIGSAKAEKKSETVDLLSSSDSDASPVANRAQVPIEVPSDSDEEEIDYDEIQRRVDEKKKKVLEKAGTDQARTSILSASIYNAEDIHVDVGEDEFLKRRTPQPIRRAPRPKPKINYGKPLRVTCQCKHLVIAGQKESIANDKQQAMLMVREKEPLSALVERFCKFHGLPHGQATVALKFDGLQLDLGKTPISYEMEDEDCIDVTATAPMRSES